MSTSVADLCDQFPDKLQIADNSLRAFGGVRRLCGVIETIRIDEDNRPVIALLEQSGKGRILVVDAHGAGYCAIIGDRLAGMAHKNGWAGIVVNGCVRDTEALRAISIGVWALGTCPIRSAKKSASETGIPVSFASITFRAGDFLYADHDGIVTSAERLTDNFKIADDLSVRRVSTAAAPLPNGHYSQAVAHNGLVFLSMQLPINPRDPSAPHGTIEQQTEQVIENVRNILEAAGCDLHRTLRITVYLTDIGLWDAVNKIFTVHFGEHKPARGVVALPALHLGYQIAMDAIAVVAR